MMPGMDPRQMAMAMRRMGIQMVDIDGVEEIVIRTASKEYRFRKAAVSVMRAQGSETWQIQGKPVVTERASSTPAASSALTAAAGGSPETPVAAPGYTPTADDVRMVMEASGAAEPAASKALTETGGDLAEAIVRLQS